MATTQKALDFARLLREELAIRLAALATPVTVQSDISFDTDECPYFQIGTGGIGAKGGIVKVAPIAWPLAKDIFGNTATIFTPHMIQICTESNSDAGSDINSPAELLPILATSCLKGTRVEWYKVANGVAPVLASIVVGNLKATYDNLYFPMISSQ